MKHKLKIDMKQDNLLFGDCKDWLPFIPDNSVDLIYIDPPFFSQRYYEIIWGNCYEKRSFEDRFKGKTHYINWMRERLIIAKDKLKKTGSIFLHCDHRANYRLRVMLDDLFNEKNFRNEIICLGDLAKRPPAKYLKNETQTIYWYSKSENYKYITEGMLKESEFDIDSDHNYKQYSNGQYGYDLPKGDYCLDTLLKKEKEGTAFRNSKGNWRVIKFLKYNKNKLIRTDKLSNLWNDLPRLDHLKNEKIGYKTQKVSHIIERIIKMVTKEDDIILDFFAGGVQPHQLLIN